MGESDSWSCCSEILSSFVHPLAVCCRSLKSPIEKHWRFWEVCNMREFSTLRPDSPLFALPFQLPFSAGEKLVPQAVPRSCCSYLSGCPGITTLRLSSVSDFSNAGLVLIDFCRHLDFLARTMCANAS